MFEEIVFIVLTFFYKLGSTNRLQITSFRLRTVLLKLHNAEKSDYVTWKAYTYA